MCLYEQSRHLYTDEQKCLPAIFNILITANAPTNLPFFFFLFFFLFFLCVFFHVYFLVLTLIGKPVADPSSHVNIDGWIIYDFKSF